MDKYLLLRFAHLIGLMLMSAGLIGVFVADMRSRQVRDVKLLAQAVTFIAVFYDGLVVPGALLLLASGTWLIISLYFMRLRGLARAAVAEGRVTPELARARAEQLALFTHFLDIPILLVIVSLGALRPNDWTQFVIGIVLAVAASSLLNYFIPRLYPWGGDASQVLEKG